MTFLYQLFSSVMTVYFILFILPFILLTVISNFLSYYADGIRLASQHAHAQAHQGKTLLITFGDPLDTSNFIEKHFLTIMKGMHFLRIFLFLVHICFFFLCSGLLFGHSCVSSYNTVWNSSG